MPSPHRDQIHPCWPRRTEQRLNDLFFFGTRKLKNKQLRLLAEKKTSVRVITKGEGGTGGSTLISLLILTEGGREK